MRLFSGAKEIIIPEDIWEMLNRAFSSDTPLVKSQYFELIRSTQLSGEVKLWLNVLIQAMDDWLSFKKHPTSETCKRLIKDIDVWAFKPSFTMDRICEAMEEAFDMESELFTLKFREWLNQNRAVDLTKKYHFDEPLESFDAQQNCSEGK